MDNIQINGFKSASEDGQLNYRNLPEKRTESLIKRIKRLQWKQLEKHATEQLEAFYTRQKNIILKNCQNVTKQEPNSQIDKPFSSKFSNCPSSQSCHKESQETQTQSQPSTPPKPSSQSNLRIEQASQFSSAQLSPPTDSPLPLVFSSTSSPIQASSKNAEKTNLTPSEEIKTNSGPPPVILVDKQQQTSGLNSSDIMEGGYTISFEPTMIPESYTSNKLTFTDEVTLQSMPAHLTLKSIPDRSFADLQSFENQLVTCNKFAPSLLDSPEDELLRSAVGILTSNLKHFEYSYDSDATESSSGGESCDEFENVFIDNFPRPDSSSNFYEPIQRKANWRWLNERSAIASRWTWLQAQVADLEFKIRQQNEMYRQLRASKGSIAFYCKESSPNASSIPNCSSEALGTNNSLGNVSNGTLNTSANAPTSNGISECSLPSVNSDSTISLSPPASTAKTSPSTQSSQQPLNSTFPCTMTPLVTTFSSPSQKASQSIKDPTTPTTTEDNNSEKEVHHCARTLPLKQMRKRKLVRSCNAITMASRKIARYSTVQCTCSNYPKFVSPCVLCNGRFSHLQMIDTDCMPNYERYALLDPSYHPVLSLPNDVALGLYFSKLLKKETVQKPLISSTTAKFTNKNRSNHTSEFSFKFGPDNKKINRRKSQAVISSTKLKKKYDGTTKKKYAKGNSNLRKRSLRGKNDQANGSGDDARTESPSPSPLSSENSNVPIHRRRRSEQYAYDINNIVIPYSIASTTRVEKLQYKEIITPKWRYVEVNNNANSSTNNDNNANNDNNNNSNSNNNNNNSSNSSSHNNLFHFDEAEETDEDTSDETFAIRHLKCEIDERKQFSSYLKNPGGSGPGRGRGARTRLDSARSDGGKNTLNNNSGKNILNSKSNPINSKITSVPISNHNINDSVQNVDLSSQDSLVTAPINLNMCTNDDSLPSSSTATTTTVTSVVPTTTISSVIPTTTLTTLTNSMITTAPVNVPTLAPTTETVPVPTSVTEPLSAPLAVSTPTPVSLSMLALAHETETASTESSESTTTETAAATVTTKATSITTSTSTSLPSLKLASKTVSMTAPPTPNSNTIMELVTDHETMHGPPGKTQNRNRTSSSSKCEDFVDEDAFIEVHPYDKRNFPISDQEYEEMLRISMESIREDETLIKSEVDDDVSISSSSSSLF